MIVGRGECCLDFERVLDGGLSTLLWCERGKQEVKF